ncbi:MAG: hypothetical protein AB7U98_01225 [Candidatus Nitrosocosmicus sp.]
MTTIIIQNRTRDLLRKVGRKQQTYDDIINELLEKSKTSIDADRSTEEER